MLFPSAAEALTDPVAYDALTVPVFVLAPTFPPATAPILLSAVVFVELAVTSPVE